MTAVGKAAGVERMRFGPLVVEFDSHVLRPRPWTVIQSEWAAELASTAPPGPILELCAGAGQIGLAAAVLGDRDLVQVEPDAVAARFAVRNATAAGHGARTQLRVRPMHTALAARERFPIVIADPPYLPTDEVAHWPSDPVHAIDGGADGLDLLRVSLRVSAQHLLPDGHLLLQVAGAAQAERVCADVPPGLTVHGTRDVDARRAVLHLTRDPR